MKVAIKVAHPKENEREKTPCVTICTNLCRSEEKSGISNGSERGVKL